MSQLKIGMVGLDTSHCGSFAEILHNEANEYFLPGGHITVAFPGGSQAFANSRNRVERISNEMKDKYGVTLVDDIATVAKQVDAILLESVDGRQHLEQFRQLAPFGKPVFIDKPIATTVSEAKAIFELAQQYNTPVYTTSSLRYANGVAQLGAEAEVLGCHAFGPMSLLEDFPGYFWYGIHSAEILYAKMGPGCKSVSVRSTADADNISGIWQDGRVGSLYGYRNRKVSTFGAVVYTSAGVEQGVSLNVPPQYALLLKNVLEFFRTGKSPIAAAESVEVIAFLEAANAARESGKDVEIQL